MKLLVLSFGLLIGGSAFAMTHHHHSAKDCTDASRYGGENDHDAYACGGHGIGERATCKEGEVQYFQVSNESKCGEAGCPEVARTCHNGTFFPHYSAEVGHRGCHEGQIAYSDVMRPGGVQPMQETVICHNGRFVEYRP